jgi:hypothetical protein
LVFEYVVEIPRSIGGSCVGPKIRSINEKKDRGKKKRGERMRERKISRQREKRGRTKKREERDRILDRERQRE